MTEELYLDWGLEGGGEELTRHTLPDGSTKFVLVGHAMSLDENDDEIVIKTVEEYPTFDAYWQQVRDKSYFPYMYYVFCHPEIKEFILQQYRALLTTADERMRPRIERTIRTIERPRG